MQSNDIETIYLLKIKISDLEVSLEQLKSDYKKLEKENKNLSKYKQSNGDMASAEIEAYGSASFSLLDKLSRLESSRDLFMGISLILFIILLYVVLPVPLSSD